MGLEISEVVAAPERARAQPKRGSIDPKGGGCILP